MNQYAAHIRKNNGHIEIQTVSEHCEGTARQAEKYAKILNLSHVARLQGIIHDLGKLRVDFDDYIHVRNNIQRGMIDHCYAGARYLMQIAESTKDKQLIETAGFIARTVVSHHGLHDWVDENGEDYFKRRISKDEKYDEIVENVHSIISENEIIQLLSDARDEYAQIRMKIRHLSDDRTLFSFYMGQFERLMQSILIDADRTDTAQFQSGQETEKDIDSNIWNLFYDRMEMKSAEFEKRTDKISRLRCDISNRCRDFSDHESGICRLIVPTGGGKTLSAFRYAVHYCKKHGKERIFYIAPYMSILEQNSDVIKEIVGEEYLLEHHSDIVSGMENDEEIAEYELRSDKWDMPVIATTLVQFLNTLFLDRMDSVRRMHRLCNSVIIIDEVQSVPTKCVSLFNLSMNFLSRIGGSSIVLCSATQPSFEKTKYSMKIDTENSITGEYSKDFMAFKRNEIISKVRREGYSYVEAADFCLERYRQEGNVLFVVNTKVAAIHIYQAIKSKVTDDTNIIHISTNMCPEHRRNVLKELSETLICHSKVICITTQLIEAGVDISFPCVIRSLAGMDNSAQAAGRCNRSNEYGRCCKVYLLNLNEEKLGSLKEIKTGQDISRQMLESNKYSDLQSVETLRDYFEKYYQEQEDELKYNIEDMGVQTDILNLLSIDSCRSSPGSANLPSYYARQAFKTAGKKFHVIDDDSISVIVPYDESAKEIISYLHSDIRCDEMVKILRKAQKYTVGIFEQTEKKLNDEHALELLQSGVYVLDERYYDQQLGIVLEGKKMDLLMF